MSKRSPSAAGIVAIAITAVVAATVSVPTSAMAAEPTLATGHYEWRPAPQNGPRVPLHAPVRIWVDASGTQRVDTRRTTLGMVAHGQSGSAGHYEWRTHSRFGPRAPLQASEHVWVPRVSSRG